MGSDFEWREEAVRCWRCYHRGVHTAYVVYQECQGGNYYATRDTYPVKIQIHSGGYRRAWWNTERSARRAIEERVVAHAVQR